MERIDHETLASSDTAIREGLIYDSIERNREGLRVEQEIPNVRRRNVIYLAIGATTHEPMRTRSRSWPCAYSTGRSRCTGSGSRRANGWRPRPCGMTWALYSTPGGTTSTPIT